MAMDDRQASGEAPRFRIERWATPNADADVVDTNDGLVICMVPHGDDAEWVLAALNAHDRRERESGV